VTDMYGEKLDFGQGRTLKSKGIVACEKITSLRVIEAVKKVLSQEMPQL
jgi:hypothetical protein